MSLPRLNSVFNNFFDYFMTWLYPKGREARNNFNIEIN